MIEFRKVSKRFGTSTAVDNFSLTAPSGKITVFMGLSGSGKTTLLRMVNRMVEPSSGSILIDGSEVAGMEPVALRRSIGYVMQEVGLLPHKTVLDNVALIANIAGQAKTEAQTNAAAMLELVGVGREYYDRYPSQLSGGQQQRVGVARALAIKPNILLMDEPFGAVDPIIREDLQDELIQIQKSLGLTIIFITHDRQEALKIADQLVILSERAKIEQVGSAQAISTTPANDFVKKLLGV